MMPEEFERWAKEQREPIVEISDTAKRFTSIPLTHTPRVYLVGTPLDTTRVSITRKSCRVNGGNVVVMNYFHGEHRA